jgi:hypothetical protein
MGVNDIRAQIVGAAVPAHALKGLYTAVIRAGALPGRGNKRLKAFVVTWVRSRLRLNSTTKRATPPNGPSMAKLDRI